MLEKLRDAEVRYCAIEGELASPEVFSDQERFTALMKEYKALTPIIEKYREYKSVSAEGEDLRSMLEDSLDPEMRELVNAEYKEIKPRLEALLEELKILLLPRDPNDDKNVMVEIRSGAGGEEAALFAGVLYRMYTMYAESAGFKVSLMNANETELGGFKEVTFMIEGDGAYSRFKFESGVHRVQRVPETESQGRIQTSTVTVAVLPEAEEVEVEVTLDELGFQMKDRDKLVKQAVNYGKKGTVWSRYQKLKETKESAVKLDADFCVDSATVEKVLTEKSSQLKGAAVNATIKRENGQFVITDGKAGVKVDLATSVENIKNYFVDESRISNKRYPDRNIHSLVRG